MIRAMLMFGPIGYGWLGFMASTAIADVTVQPSERGEVVKIDGQPFAEYLTLSGHEPALWPVIGPTGQPMTRSFPAGPRILGETDDHPHHHSIWFAHGNVNGIDFWTDRSASPDKKDNQIVHRGYVDPPGRQPADRIISRNDWVSDGKKICEDERTVVFGKRENGDRWIDYRVKLTASEGDITLGDTKEGTFGVRVADSLSVDAKIGGRIVNSRGEVNEAAWGKPAEWVDNSGPVAGETVGIAIFSHPSSFRPTCRWHARVYGLLAANPFGEREFLAEGRRRQQPQPPLQGAHTLAKGDSLSFRYRVLLHRGDAEQARVADAYREFVEAK